MGMMSQSRMGTSQYMNTRITGCCWCWYDFATCVNAMLSSGWLYSTHEVMGIV